DGGEIGAHVALAGAMARQGGGVEQVGTVVAGEPCHEIGEVNVEIAQVSGGVERGEVGARRHRAPPIQRSSASTSSREGRSSKTPHAAPRAGVMPRRKR